MPWSIQPSDIVTIGLLIGLEGLLSADNALVMAVMVLGLPPQDHRRALSYGLVGAFTLRAMATALAVYLILVPWVKLAGGAYLLYLVVDHFRHREPSGDGRQAPKAKPLFGLSPFWATILRVEMVNLAFSIDSILVAVGMSTKFWVVLSGGLLGLITMRVVVGQVIKLIQRYPSLVDAAFVIIGWVAIKLVLDYAHQVEWIGWEVPQGASLGIIAVIFGMAVFLARRNDQ